MKFALIILVFFIKQPLLSQIIPDSVVLSKEGIIIAQIFKDSIWCLPEKHYTDYYEYRFYDAQGFYCISLRKSDGKFSRIHESYLNSEKGVNLEKDLIFKADTFAIGFINKMKSYLEVDLISKFENTVNYYYHSRDYRRDSLLAAYIDSIIIKNNLLINDTLRYEEGDEQEVFFIIAGPPTPTFDENFISYFNKEVIKDIYLTKRQRRRINRQLDFYIEADRTGTITELRRLTDVNKRINKKIDNNIEAIGVRRIRPGPARGRGYNLKAAFFIEI